MGFKYATRVTLLFGFVVVGTIGQSDDVVVQIPNGKIRGVILQTRQERNVFTFYGIRYAEPPTGKNRFKPPIAAKKWNGVYNAAVNGQACMQNEPPSNYNLSEDCLFLDVYSADLSASKPVILFIHGGGLVGGSKLKASFEYLLDKEVVLVAINYRLSAFGFFSMGTKLASGNQGLKDQNLALRWVRDNVKYFGGNPNLITLSGQSAGSMSVTLHMLSPMSQGLFHRAIAMSGSAVSHIESYTRNTSKKFLEITNCDRDDVAFSIECLQNLPVKAIMEATSQLDSLLLPWNYDIESIYDEQPFITEHPVDLARNRHIQPIPLMAGTMYDEMYCLKDVYIQPKPHIACYLRQFHDQIFPKSLLYRYNSNRIEISERLYSYYMNDSHLTTSELDYQIGKLVSDAIINHGMHCMAEYTRQVTNVFYYRMDYKGRYSLSYDNNGKPQGATHEDDLQYAIVFKQIAPVLSVNDPENPTIERMTSWWSKFAETGNPNDASNNWTNAVYWTPSTKYEVKTLYINETYTLSTEPYQNRYNLWDSLFPLY